MAPPVLRGAAAPAKTAAALDLLSGGRLALGVGPGSSSGRSSTARRCWAPYARAGVDEIFVWPVDDLEDQLDRFMHDVVPLVPVR